MSSTEPEATVSIKPSITIEAATPVAQHGFSSPFSNMDDFAKMLLRKHETLKQEQIEPICTGAQQTIAEPLVTVSVNKQYQLQTDDFSALSLTMDQSTLPLESVVYSPLKCTLQEKTAIEINLQDQNNQESPKSPLKFCEQVS